MAKFLVLIALGIVAYLIVSRMRREGQRTPPPGKPSGRLPEDMVQCSVCGVNLPRSESITSRGLFYCTDEHRRLG